MKKSVTFQEETFAEYIEDAMPLLEENCKETNLFGMELDLNKGLYEAAHSGGWLRIFTIRAEQELVGYCAYFVFTHSHHKTSRHAKQDVIFIKRGHRGRCLSFLAYCDQELKNEGVEFIQQSVPVMNDWSPVLKRLGYTKIEEIYIRGL